MTSLDREHHIRFWRLRAEELRATASEFKERIVRKGLFDAAAVYDRLADQAERPAKTASESAKQKPRRPTRKVSRPQRGS